MSLIFVDIVDKCNLPIESCDHVYVCLGEEWITRTKIGVALATGRVTRISKYVTPNTVTNCCTTTTVCVEECIYQIEINDDQFHQDPVTLKPYLVGCSDINGLIGYACTVSALIAGIQHGFGGDIYLDYNNVTIVPDAVANANDITLPVTNAGIPVGTAVVSVPAGELASGPGTLVYTSGAGVPDVISICDVIESCMDGVTITRTGAGSTYEVNLGLGAGSFASGTAASGTETQTYSSDGTVIYQGPETLTNDDLCASAGINEHLMQAIAISDTDWVLSRVPEHGTLSEVVNFDQQNYEVGDVPSLMTGDSDVQTPAYREVTFNNPSDCRPMPYMVFANQSFSGASIPASGQVVWGNTLWIDGVKITTQNGRSLPGFNISWADSPGYLQDYTMPIHYYAGVLPAGGSVTVGLDFGDNDVFITTGTPTALAVESFIIGIIGSTT